MAPAAHAPEEEAQDGGGGEEGQEQRGGRPDQNGNARPRRPDAETLTYLRSLEPLIDQSVQALAEGGGMGRQGPRRGRRGEDGDEENEEEEEEGENRALLVSNLIDEITFKVASLAMDRHAAPVLEKLARLCTRRQLARLVQACVGYGHSLAANRYSSHVLQTFLSLAGPMVQAELEGQDEEDEDESEGSEEEAPVLLRTAAAELAQELQASWFDIMHDLCGSHVVRALFCLLTGMPVVAERRGRHSKHQHNIETAFAAAPAGGAAGASPNAAAAGADSPYAARLPMYAVPDEFVMLRESLVLELGRLELMSLHQALCDPHAGPALCLLVQAVARAEGPESLSLDPEGAFLKGVVLRALCWAKPERRAELVYAMAGETLGSRFLEAVLWHTDPATVAAGVFASCLKGRLAEFAEHEVANFVLQAWLQRTASADHLKAALEELAPAFPALVRARRAGVLWRLAGACLRLRKHEKKVMKALLAGLSPDKSPAGLLRALLVLQGHRGGGGEEDEDKATAGPLVLKVSEADGRLHLNVPGARLLECLMRFPADLAAPVCQAVAALPAESLLALARDNVGSRALLDPVLLYAATAPPSSSAAAAGAGGLGDALAGKWRGHYADLAAHPVGFHVLTRCFASCLSLPGKRQVAEELLAAEGRLAGAHFGRRALGSVGVSLFRANRAKWEESMEKGEKKKQVLEELFEMLDGSSSAGAEAKQRKAEEEKKGKKTKKDKEAAGKATAADPLMALLLGEGGGGKEPVEKEGADEQPRPEGGSLDFVLDALKKKTKKGKKKGGGGDGEGEEEGEGEPARRPPSKPGGGREQEARPRGGKGKGEGGGKRPRHADKGAARPVVAREGETPVEKARRLLGKRAMMSKTELLSAVGELEREVGKKEKKKKV